MLQCMCVCVCVCACHITVGQHHFLCNTCFVYIAILLTHPHNLLAISPGVATLLLQIVQVDERNCYIIKTNVTQEVSCE